uniref:Uncharacterized protein n=1 Tax=Attheya septentrionalis TaxID=420275 RepID=A0A7S2UC00_9STRA|mmetsp:Transcript_1905/g.3421  ORF Transcript_1905/g.3421 Transcript_1905/m.3421 type:complete len:100 (+) Transcript_1905:141-440(+)
MLLVVTAFCLALQLLLPCIVIVGRRYEKRRLESEQRALAFYEGDKEEEDEARDGHASPRTKAQMQSLASNANAALPMQMQMQMLPVPRGQGPAHPVLTT